MYMIINLLGYIDSAVMNVFPSDPVFFIWRSAQQNDVVSLKLLTYHWQKKKKKKRLSKSVVFWFTSAYIQSQGKHFMCSMCSFIDIYVLQATPTGYSHWIGTATE